MRSIHCYDVIRVNSKGAFQEPVVRFVPDNAQFGQRMTYPTTLHDFSHKFRLVTEHVGVFLKDCRARPSLDQTRPSEFKYERRCVVPGGKRGQLQDARIKDDSQDTVWRDATRARRLASTNSIAFRSLKALPRFSRWARASAGDNLNRTTFPPTMAVACMRQDYPKERIGQDARLLEQPNIQCLGVAPATSRSSCRLRETLLQV